MRRLVLGRLRKRHSLQRPARIFSYNISSLSASRPQVPFLSIPSRPYPRQQWRYLTTERKAWIKYEMGLAAKWTCCIWAMAGLVVLSAFIIQQEFLEHRYPTPHEWSLISRFLKRGAQSELMRPDVVEENWPVVIQLLLKLLERLENTGGDGAGLKDLGPESPPGAKDISAMPEPWRRGYYEALLLCCEASEHVEGWVLDTSRRTVFPPDVVKGPSNPFPKPIPAWAKESPHEKNCVPADFPEPDVLYQKLLATKGLTTRQRMDAALAYANWLEYKGFLEPAAVVYEEALGMAIEEIQTPGAPPLLDPKTSALNSKAERKPSTNLLSSLTEVATFKARHEDVAGALPILISILQARRSLPSKKASGSLADYEHRKGLWQNFLEFIKEPDYPPPPPDGAAPPMRDSKELCEEAALHIHIGEIMFTLQGSTREDGLAWTREGVDLAEQELHKLAEEVEDLRDAKKTCRECLSSGLENWGTMVRRMLREEQERKAKNGSAGWFGLWSGKKGEEAMGRWEAEDKVVEDRTKRAQPILEDLVRPSERIFSRLVKA